MCGLALETGGSSDEQRSELYHWRGMAYAKRGDYDLAISDFTAITRLGGAAYFDRALAYQAKGDSKAAIADFDRVGSVYGDWASMLARYYDGRYAEAAEELERRLAEESNFPDGNIWLAFIRQRTHQDWRTGLSAQRRALGDGEWPLPILRAMLGEISRDDAMKAAAHWHKYTEMEQQCTATLVLGEQARVLGELYEAKQKFQKALGTCPWGLDFVTALTALRRL